MAQTLPAALTSRWVPTHDGFTRSHVIVVSVHVQVLIGDKRARMAGTSHQPLVAPTRRLLGLRTNVKTNAHEIAASSEADMLDLIPGRANWHSAVKLMTQVHATEASRQAEADARVQESKVKPKYEFYGECYTPRPDAHALAPGHKSHNFVRFLFQIPG
jgi:hypothetical protein